MNYFLKLYKFISTTEVIIPSKENTHTKKHNASLILIIFTAFLYYIATIFTAIKFFYY
jgi:hypothetical protein